MPSPLQPENRCDPRAGFTLVELMIASTILTVVLAAAVVGYTSTLRFEREGSEHIKVIEEARAAEQDIARFIQTGRAISASSDAINVMMSDGSQARLQFVDADGDPQTVDDNTLEFDPDTGSSGDEQVVCREVAPINGEAMFQLVPTSPRTALVTFHVGELPPADGNHSHLGSGQGYQGTEVRVSATPRNLGTVYK